MSCDTCSKWESCLDAVDIKYDESECSTYDLIKSCFEGKVIKVEKWKMLLYTRKNKAKVHKCMKLILLDAKLIGGTQLSIRYISSFSIVGMYCICNVKSVIANFSVGRHCYVFNISGVKFEYSIEDFKRIFNVSVGDVLENRRIQYRLYR